MTLQLFSLSNGHGGELSAEGLLGRNHEEETCSNFTLSQVSVEPYSFSEGSERTAFKATDMKGDTFVLKRIKRSNQDAKVYVDIRNYADILAKVISYS